MRGQTNVNRDEDRERERERDRKRKRDGNHDNWFQMTSGSTSGDH